MPIMRAVPLLGRKKPVIIFIVVDLPAPLGPKIHDLPARDNEGQIIDGGKIPEFFDQMLDFNHALYSSPLKPSTFR